MSYVEFKDVGKTYSGDKKPTVKGFNLEIKKGEFIVFVGPSGCGKSTTLRMVAGLEEITTGEMTIDGNLINEVAPKDRDIAMVFQNYALYPHMSVYENISFGLKLQKIPKNEIDEKVNWAADILGLTEYLERVPKDLSGGQRQRVALGRAIVRNPKVFLMDEPLSNLDAKLRGHMRNEITNLHTRLNATTIYVTHDQIEAMTMADRIVVMKDGLIQQIGTPMELYNKPANLFVAGFIGAPQMNFMEVFIDNNQITFKDGKKIEIPDGIVKKLENTNGEVILGIRPEHIRIDALNISSWENQTIEGKIDNIENMGHESHIFTSIADTKIILRAQRAINEYTGGSIKFVIDLNKCHFFDKSTEKSIFEPNDMNDEPMFTNSEEYKI